MQNLSWILTNKTIMGTQKVNTMFYALLNGKKTWATKDLKGINAKCQICGNPVRVSYTNKVWQWVHIKCGEIKDET